MSDDTPKIGVSSDFLVFQALEMQLSKLEGVLDEHAGEPTNMMPLVCMTCYEVYDDCQKQCDAGPHWPLTHAILKLRTLVGRKWIVGLS